MSVYDRVIITGGGGMLAGSLRRSLSRRQADVQAFTRADLDIADLSSVARVVDSLRPTLVLNCAAYTKVDLAEQEQELAGNVNGTGPANLAQHCKQVGAKLVHYSTDYVFDGTLRRPLRVDDPVGPQSAYGKSKLAGEQALQRLPGLDFILIRTAWLYGPAGPSFPKTMLDVARAGKPLRVVNDQIGAPTFTDDLAEATLDLVDRDARAVYHVTNGGQTSWFDFARAIFEEFGLQPDLAAITSDDWKKMKPASASRPAYSVLDMSKFEQTVGRSMRPWREALQAFRALA